MNSFKFSIKASVALAIGALSVASPALADDYAFGFSGYDGGEYLNVNGSTDIYTNGYQGWVSTEFGNVGGPVSNTNYIIGQIGTALFRDYFIFDLTGLTGVSSASLTVSPYGITNSFNLRLGAASALVPSLINAASPNSALYNAMDDGTLYGVFGINSGMSFGGPLTFSLNAAAVSDLNAAIKRGDQYFAISGSITPDVGGAVPEAATWSMMIAGLGLVGAAMRRTKLAVRFA